MLGVARNVMVVTGAHEARVRAEVPIDERVRVVHNSDFLQGQLSSLKCAIAAIRDDAAGAIVHLADLPLVQPATFQAVTDKFAARGASSTMASGCR